MPYALPSITGDPDRDDGIRSVGPVDAYGESVRAVRLGGNGVLWGWYRPRLGAGTGGDYSQ